MKKYLVLGLFLLSFLAKAQETEKVSVAKELFGVQLGVFNASFLYETKLDRKLTLHTEFGFGLGFVKVISENKAIADLESTIVFPYINIEPRWYFGLDKRARLNRTTNNNNSNYFSLSTNYRSNNTLLVNTGNLNVTPQFSIVPQFGMRRVFLKKFFFEEAVGVGYGYNFFDDTIGCNCSHNQTVVSFSLKTGYNF